MSYAKGIFGYALYMELRREGRTTQHIWTPAVVDREAREFVSPKYLSRTVSDLNRRKKWKYTDFDVSDVTYNLSTGLLDQIEDLGDAASAMRKPLDSIMHNLRTGRETGWTITGEPLILEVTAADIRNFRLYSTPEALNRRIMAARADAHYPESLWDKA